jgi:hypothetical protein
MLDQPAVFGAQNSTRAGKTGQIRATSPTPIQAWSTGPSGLLVDTHFVIKRVGPSYVYLDLITCGDWQLANGVEHPMSVRGF